MGRYTTQIVQLGYLENYFYLSVIMDRTQLFTVCTCLSENSEVNVFPLEFVKDNLSAVLRTVFHILLSGQ